MTDGQRVTGMPDEMYDLISVLYHTLQGGETSHQYIDDACEAGDDELARFFQDVQQEDRGRASRAMQLLASRMEVALT